VQQKSSIEAPNTVNDFAGKRLEAIKVDKLPTRTMVSFYDSLLSFVFFAWGFRFLDADSNCDASISSGVNPFNKASRARISF
jgi:hypothetical protein